MYSPAHSQRGFTLIELMMAMTLFGVVTVVATAALLSVVDASRKAQAIQSVMGNLNTALDGMVRAVRMGSNYRLEQNGNKLSFTPYGKDPLNTNDTWIYEWRDTNSDGRPDALVKDYVPLGYVSRIVLPVTAPEVEIDYMKFYVDGELDTDDKQPRVLLVVRGRAGVEKVKTTTTFSIQASATQRLLDL
jgi:prepilin-type N-terminal cleavage/methylation domain-containing protein